MYADLTTTPLIEIESLFPKKPCLKINIFKLNYFRRTKKKSMARKSRNDVYIPRMRREFKELSIVGENNQSNLSITKHRYFLSFLH